MKSIADLKNEVLDTNIIRSDGKVNSNIIRHLDNHPRIKSIVRDIHNYYNAPGDLKSSYLIVLCINGYKSLPTCSECSAVLTHKAIRNVSPIVISSYCSHKCAGTSQKRKDKRATTFVERYGVEYPSQRESFKDSMNTPEMRKKKADAMHSYYNNLRSSGAFDDEMGKRNEKRRSTAIEKYGSYDEYIETRVTSYKNNNDMEDVNSRRSASIRDTIIKRYGSYKSLQKHKKPYTNPNYLRMSSDQVDILTNRDSFVKELENSNDSIEYMSARTGLAVCTLYLKCKQFEIERNGNISYPHILIMNMLDDMRVDYTINDRTIITPYEIDVMVGDSIGIEINGVTWHSDKVRDKNYHLMKTEMASTRGVHLIHLTDVEIINNQYKIESFLASLVNSDIRVLYARKCSVVEIELSRYRELCNMWHMQGYAYADCVYGLEYEGELVQVMSFSRSRFNQSYQYELVRLCTTRHTRVVGGASRLLSRFKKEKCPSSIISYCDRSLHTGRVYEQLGFIYDGDTNIGYRYYKSGKLYSRYTFQKHKLKDKFPDIWSEDKTEYEIMSEAGYLRIWDCGNRRFVWNDRDY